MEKITNSQLMEMMDIVSSSPELRERVERRIQSNRRSKKAYNARAYQYVKQHREMIEQAIQTPAGFGDFGADLSTMQVEAGMEIDKPKKTFQGSVYFRCLEAKEKANESRRG